MGSVTCCYRTSNSNEGAKFGWVFAARGEFDSGDDIDAAGIEQANGVGDVGGVETSGDDEGLAFFDVLDKGK